MEITDGAEGTFVVAVSDADGVDGADCAFFVGVTCSAGTVTVLARSRPVFESSFAIARPAPEVMRTAAAREPEMVQSFFLLFMIVPFCLANRVVIGSPLT